MLAAVIGLMPVSGFADSDDDGFGLDWTGLSFKIKPWLSHGQSYLRTSALVPAAQTIPVGAEIYLGDTLEFSGTDALLLLYSVEARPWKWLAFDVQFARNGLTSAGSEVDHSWIHSPDANVRVLSTGHIFKTPDHEDYAMTRASAGGTTEWFSVNVYGKVFSGVESLDEFTYAHSLELIAGYSHYQDEFRLSNGAVTMSTDYFIPIGPTGPFPGLDEPITLQWDGPRFGLRETIRTRSLFRFEMAVAFSPFMTFKESGLINLSRSLRRESPNFEGDSGGNLLDASLALVFSPRRRLKLELGYMILYLTAGRGTETFFLADGSQFRDHIDRAWSRRDGLFASLAYSF